MKYISFVWWIAKYCDFFYFFLFVICVCLHPHINTPAVNCEERSKLSTGGYQLTGRVHGLSEHSISILSLTLKTVVTIYINFLKSISSPNKIHSVRTKCSTVFYCICPIENEQKLSFDFKIFIKFGGIFNLCIPHEAYAH